MLGHGWCVGEGRSVGRRDESIGCQLALADYDLSQQTVRLRVRVLVVASFLRGGYVHTAQRGVGADHLPALIAPRRRPPGSRNNHRRHEQV